jgi:hypothetical protein
MFKRKTKEDQPPAPALSTAERIQQLEAELAALKAQPTPPVDPPPAGPNTLRAVGLLHGADYQAFFLEADGSDAPRVLRLENFATPLYRVAAEGACRAALADLFFTRDPREADLRGTFDPPRSAMFAGLERLGPDLFRAVAGEVAPGGAVVVTRRNEPASFLAAGEEVKGLMVDHVWLTPAERAYNNNVGRLPGA